MYEDEVEDETMEMVHDAPKTKTKTETSDETLERVYDPDENVYILIPKTKPKDNIKAKAKTETKTKTETKAKTEYGKLPFVRDEGAKIDHKNSKSRKI